MPENILNTIAAATRKRVALAREVVSLEEMQTLALALTSQQASSDKKTLYSTMQQASSDKKTLFSTMQQASLDKKTLFSTPQQASSDKVAFSSGNIASVSENSHMVNFDFPFEKALAQEGMSFICECKKASPSKGLIAPDFPYLEIARAYEAAGASAISVLTEPEWFQGSNDILREIAQTVQTPCLRKDFTVDEYMIYEAKVLGASAVLLICALLDTKTLRDYIRICDTLGLSAVVEAHDEAEIHSAIEAGARIIGVNNRNLKDFTVDVRNSIALRELVPRDILFIAESGIQTREDICILEEAGVNAVLIGETLMKATDKKSMLDSLRGVL